MPNERPVEPVVDAVVHLRGDAPLVAKIGGKRVLLVPPSVIGKSLAHIVEGLSLTDEGHLAVTDEDPPRIIYGAGGTTAAQNEKDDDEEDPPTKYGPGGVPARVDPTVLSVDLDELLNLSVGPIVPGHSNRQLRVGDVAHIVVPPDERSLE